MKNRSTKSSRCRDDFYKFHSFRARRSFASDSIRTSTGLQTLPVPALLTLADPALVAQGVGPLGIDTSMPEIVAA